MIFQLLQAPVLEDMLGWRGKVKRPQVQKSLNELLTQPEKY